MRRLSGVFVLVVASAATCGARPARAQQFDVPQSAKAAIIAQTNGYRASKGLPPLRENVSASEEAQSYANYLAETMRQGHSADGRSPFTRLRASGAKFCKFRGENWHESWTRPVRTSPEAAVVAAMTFWKRSPGHERALRSNSNEIGVGMSGWRHGNQWYYQEIQVFIDTSCLKPIRTALNELGDPTPPLPDRKPVPPLPDRNPSRP
jgi:uncharacterized protein YkwD